MSKLSPLADVSSTKAVLDAHGLSSKYTLGQNFLIDDNIVQKIIALAQLNPNDYVLEVGPGIGTLTIALLKSAGQVVAVERDTDMLAVLDQTLASWREQVRLINKDALDVRLDDLQSKANANHKFPNKFVANLPYAVAATVVLDYFERFAALESATVMVQKEVADRMVACPGSKNYGAYTVKLALRVACSNTFSVGPRNFFPPPHVESSVVRLDRRNLCDDAGCVVDQATIEAACTMADAAFATRRKTIANSCKTYFSHNGEAGVAVVEALPNIFEQAKINPQRRGETLDLQEFVRLARALQAFT